MCVLRASGEEFDPDAFLATSKLEPSTVYRRGEARFPRAPKGPHFESSGIHLSVSDRSFSELPAQMVDAVEFLTTNRTELERLAESPGITDLTLDFPIALRIDGERVVAQFDRFPASLVRAAGSLGLALELSIYPVSNE